MIVASAFHSGDRARALTWLQWITELGGCKRHEIILMPAKDVADYEPLKQEAAKAFGKVSVLPDGEGVKGWPQGPNSNIRQLVWHIWHLHLGPVFHLENDCIPITQLVPDWLDQIEAEYQSAGKPFMGALVQPGDGTPDHLTGNMVMPWNAVLLAPMLSNRGMSVTREELAFDITAAPQILPLAHRTNLIQQVFNVNGECPTFPDQDSLSIISKEAVLFHRNKDGSLIDRLRDRRSNKCQQGSQVERHEVHNLDIREFDPHSCKVFTYFSPVESEEGQAEQQRILELWKETWAASGWEPVVLTEEDAKKHPRYEEWKAAFKKLPIENPSFYEMPCFMRWVAMAATSAQLMTDYDVLPNGFRLLDSHNQNAKWAKLRLFCRHVPCAVFGIVVDSWIDRLISRNPKSDMQYFMDAHSGPDGEYETSEECKEWGEDGWQSAKLIHFSHRACDGRLRSEVMAEVLASRAQPKPIAQASSPMTAADHIAALKVLCKVPLSKARIVKHLKAAGIVK